MTTTNECRLDSRRRSSRGPWTEARWRFLSRVFGLSSNVMILLVCVVNSALEFEFKGGPGPGKCSLSVGKSHARNPTRFVSFRFAESQPEPTRAKPNHTRRLSSAPCPLQSWINIDERTAKVCLRAASYSPSPSDSIQANEHLHPTSPS